MDFNRDKQRGYFDIYEADLGDSRYRKIGRLLKEEGAGRILEVGCSGGEFLEFLRDHGWDVAGVEISEKAAERAGERGIEVVVCDVNEGIPFEDEKFEVVLAGEVIEHMFDDLGFLDECERVLVDGGLLVFTTPNLVSLKNRLLMLLGLNPRFAVAPYHYHVYTRSLLEDLIRKSGFGCASFYGNYVVYSRCRERLLGGFFEFLGEAFPSLAENFIVVARKSGGLSDE